MATKYGRKELPPNHSSSDFECFGPPALEDGQFENTKIADMGCFNQEGVDSNKYYHGSVVKSTKTGKWFAYFEWGRTDVGRTPDFQFFECADEAEAQEIYAEQLHSKNTKRGEFAVIGGVRTLRAKAGKDCYLVRPQSTRSTGLPDARKIQVNDGAPKAAPKPVTKAKGKVAAAAPRADSQTIQLMKDLNVATVNFTKGAMSTGSVPTQKAIDDARKILLAARDRVKTVGDDVDAQINDRELKELTSVLYGKIPKTKPLNAAASTWILSKDNIFAWDNDLNAFESAGQSVAVTDADPFGGMQIEMSWVDPASSLGAFIMKWAPGATRGRHGYGRMVIRNIWKIARHGDEAKIDSVQVDFAAQKLRWSETPLHQPSSGRPELKPEKYDTFKASHTAMLFHGTRSVNVSGILRKSLILPERLVNVVITGAAFGPGLYFADDWMKSAGYTSLSGSFWSRGGGAVQGRHAFMFISDVALGKPYLCSISDGFTKAPNGHHSVFGKGEYTKFGNGYSGILQNNEWIVYKENQQMLRYLLEFSTA